MFRYCGVSIYVHLLDLDMSQRNHLTEMHKLWLLLWQVSLKDMRAPFAACPESALYAKKCPEARKD